MASLVLRDYSTVRVNDFSILVLIAVCWILLAILVNPIGNFPSNDDWAFGWTVKTLVTTGEFRLSDWAAPNLLPQVLIGALFTLPVGFSFTALRFSTLTLGLAGVLVTYGLLREANAGRGVALFGASTVAFNPLYFPLANTFMTDVPSFTFFVSSVYCVILGFKRRCVWAFGLGLALAFIAILNRQSSVIIFPALALAYFCKDGLNNRTIRNAIIVCTSAAALYIAYPQWLKLTGRASIMYDVQTNQLLQLYSNEILHVGSTYARNIAIMAIYLGMFTLPFLIIVFAAQYSSLAAWQQRTGIVPAVLIVATAAVYFAAKKPMPLTGNILNSFDIGGQSLPGYEAFLGPLTVGLIRWIWRLLTVLGVVGAALLLGCALAAIGQLRRTAGQNFAANGKSEKAWQMLFIVGLTLMYLLTVAGLEERYWFDRYLIVCLPLLMMVASMVMDTLKARKSRIEAIASATALLTFYGGITVAGTQDHLASNRVLWQALNSAIGQGKIAPDQIDGGFEFNGWYFGNRLATCNPIYSDSIVQINADVLDFKCLYDNEKWEYKMSYVPEPGFVVEHEYQFKRWLPWGNQHLYLLHKQQSQ